MTAPAERAPGRRPLPFRHPAILLATGFGIGRSPVAPGSCASLAALPVAWAIRRQCGAAGLAAAAVAAFLLGWWAAATIARRTGAKDPGFVVIDEIAAQWLVLLAAPLDPFAYALGFVLFRIFDICKPWPVGWADRRLRGGFGIMLDDILAGAYAGALLVLAGAVRGAIGVRS